MQGIFYLVAGILSLLQVLAGPITVESISSIPHGWSYAAAARDEDVVSVSVALKHRGIETLKKRLELTSNPNSSQYGHRTSRNEVQKATSADDASVEAVIEWLGASGIEQTNIGTKNDMIEVTAKAELVKRMLDAKELGYYSFQHKRDDGTSTHRPPVLRARSYSVPEEVRHHISFIHPLNNFIPPIRQPRIREEDPTDVHRRGMDLGACINATVPACIREMYNMTFPTENVTSSEARLGIVGFLEQFINYGDVEEWRKEYVPEVPASYNFTVDLINNGTNDQTLYKAGIEASLDVEYAMALAYPVQIEYYSTGGRGVKLGPEGEEIRSDNEPYLEVLQYMLSLADDDLPHVISVSYADDEQSVPEPYAVRVCDLFAALTSRGTTIIVATGDGGAGGIGVMECKANDGSDEARLLSTFPASCPYVTAVGATIAAYPPVWAASFSTGGFSQYFDRQDFQAEVLGVYLKAELKGVRDDMINPLGRAIPDLSAVGNGFKIRYGGGPSTVLGTSASTPVVASLVSLAVDRRIKEGKSGWLGWLTPALYQQRVSETLYDVQDGTSVGCRYNGTRISGWNAREGWDAMTGIGAINDSWEFLEALTALPSGNSSGPYVY
ncbi:tripeptidyl peptidase sed3 [Zalerion maritima]|uniref:tripeptidyl-peptidase II n=1 Tax=Zalerion maritima TaxID=339359 RepID=A0AAD5WUG9_9PEZI|nr:tripeptidyl peptidase sed3 [Zalerion maritima]